MRARHARWRNSRMSIPSSVTHPPVGSWNRGIMSASVDLPAPEVPASATTSAAPSMNRASASSFPVSTSW